MENNFQKDMEGVIINQDENQDGYLIVPHIDIKQLLNDYNAGLVSKDINIMQTILCNSEIICGTKNFIDYINGYLCCFYIIKKSQIIFKDSEIHFPNENDYNNFFFFLNEYSNNGYAYISVYDAETLLSTLCSELHSKEYDFTNGFVQYKNLSEKEKINMFKEKNIYKIVFTKNEIFKYQKEFRIFLTPKNGIVSEFIEEKICPLSNSIVNNFVYLSPDFCIEKGIKK